MRSTRCGFAEFENWLARSKWRPHQTGFFQLQIDYESEKPRRAQIPLDSAAPLRCQSISGHTQIEPRFRTMVRTTGIRLFGHEVRKRSPRP
jgi:hypothetical protein